MARVCVYMEQWDFASEIEFDLLEGERILSVHNTGMYRQVWIEGTPKTRDERFDGPAWKEES